MYGTSTGAGIGDIQLQLVSALTIALVVVKYNVPLVEKQWGDLIQGLRFPLLKKLECSRLIRSILETFKPPLTKYAQPS